jgi:hypothetical protein
MKLTAEEFLREKLASEISNFGDGTTEFHTRDIEHLLKCLDEKDEQIKDAQSQCVELINKINWDAEKQFNSLLDVCMTINNLSAEERLGYIRHTYKKTYDELKKAS